MSCCSINWENFSSEIAISLVYKLSRGFTFVTLTTRVKLPYVWFYIPMYINKILVIPTPIYSSKKEYFSGLIFVVGDGRKFFQKENSQFAISIGLSRDSEYCPARRSSSWSRQLLHITRHFFCFTYFGISLLAMIHVMSFSLLIVFLVLNYVWLSYGYVLGGLYTL